jgi:hypothetical protein
MKPIGIGLVHFCLGVGSITALTWALEIGDFTRFASIKGRSATAVCAAKRRVQQAR